MTADIEELNKPQERSYLGSISAVSRVRSLILPDFPEQRLVIEPRSYPVPKMFTPLHKITRQWKCILSEW